jgi:putative peptide zinc metalloprotease protein
MAVVVTPELPKLRSDLRQIQQETADGVAFVLKDPATGRYFRFREAEQFIAQQLDGATPLEAICQRAEAYFGQSCPTDTLKAFVDRLQQLGLLESPTAPRQSSWTAGRVRGDVFYLRLKAFDPDRFLAWCLPKLRFCFTSAFVMSSAVLILFAFGLTLLNEDQITRDAANLYGVGTLVLIWLALFAVDLLHELAHGLTCKRFGGEVHELGFMLLFFQPAFYCNVSDAWLFPRKMARLWVTFAGVYSELCISAVAALIWRVTAPGTWINAVALVIVGTSGIRTFFNFNPLIKLDGYYLLSDALEIPNLRMRSFRYLRAMIIQTLFPGSLWAAAVVQEATPREKKIYLTYSILAGIFSVWLLGSIALWVGGFLVQHYQGSGFLLFTGLLAAVFRRPLKRFAGAVMGALRTAPTRISSMKRPVKSALLLAVAVSVLFLGRMELTISGEFTVLPIQNADVRTEVEGIIQAVFVEEGDLVGQGDPIAALSDRDYRAEFNKTTAEIKEKQAKLRMLELGPRPEEVELARKARVTVETRQEQARKRYAEAGRLRAERQAGAETTAQKGKERVKYAQQSFERLKTLFEKGLISRKELEETEEQMTVRGREVEEAQASLKEVLADDLADFEKEMAVTEKELDEADGRLSVLLAGSRTEEIEATKAEIARLEAQQQLVGERLRLLRIVSPHTGVITTRRMKELVGRLVSKGDLIAEVHDLRTIEGEISIPEQEIADVQVGQDVVLKARAYPTENFEGVVSAIAPAAVKTEGAVAEKIIRVITKIDNAPLRLKSQMTGNAKIYAGKRSIAELLTRRLVRYLRVEFWAWW